jgi:ferric-dicitrate binding protein FerR (iron transport regulator)
MIYPDEKIAFCKIATDYLADEASAADRERLVEYLKNEEFRALFEEMREAWEGSPGNERECDVESLSREIFAAIRNEVPGPVEQGKPYGRAALASILRDDRWFSWRPYLLSAMAASIAILATVAIFRFQSRRAATAAEPLGQRAALVEDTCRVGERLLVTLSDGTRITLNSGSSLVHPQTFGPHNRAVRLTGEAFFDVTHDPAHPFIIETPTLRVTVVGTQFDVRAYDDGTRAQVSVVEGRVQVAELQPNANIPLQPVLLTPGQQYGFSPETKVADVQSVAPEAATAWIQDAFVWEDEPVLSAMRQLERRYGFTVEFSDPKLGTEKLNGNFEGQSPEEIFEALRRTRIIDCRIERDHGKIKRVILSPGSLANVPPDW